jgi:hypothetical protein
MSELDVDVRAVSSASFGARNTVADANQTPADEQAGLTSQPVDGNDQSANAGSTGVPVAVAQPTFRYDSFRFIYRSDYGRIVLVDQNPETGKPISQIPSQRALQLYAEQNRTEEQHAAANTVLAPKAQAGTGAASGRGGFVTPQLGKSSGLGGSGVVSSTPSAPTPTTPQALQVPSLAFAAPSSSSVNITI